ncbi:MAG TPA: C4-type zinc ribbon domain-containing protein [Nocardioides sp.]|uniref:zinc ribbon domain-containing protein n=1 Tax=Nocardioides sp. TaxID=35761 RepID=UPI002E31CADC|nr:C4-type zinc ribbon domain-containing protein [Nocardioides sp.]HEX5088709.1 C4-type zinc ribbon domain-containing protein [Nocardioides sp.]
MDSTTHRRRALKADPAAQLALLGLQELDSRADQLRHQRENLPEIAEIAALTAGRAELDGRRRDAQIAVDDLTAEQAKVDADVGQVKSRKVRDEQRMDQGLITSPKDLERMQGELESLQRRITTLEDEELEVMARLEDAQRDLDSLTDQVAAADERLAALGEARDKKTQELDDSLRKVAEERGPAADGIPADLMALYDRLRASKGGVAVGALRARECGGCRLALDPAELASIRAAAPDEVIRHEECQRILVRTPESGL